MYCYTRQGTEILGSWTKEVFSSIFLGHDFVIEVEGSENIDVQYGACRILLLSVQYGT